MKNKRALGEALRDARDRRGFSQTDLAAAAGIEANYVSQIESGRRTPSLPVLGSRAAVLGMSPGELLGGENRPERSVEDLLREAQAALRRERERPLESLFAQGGFADLTAEEKAEVEGIVREEVERIRRRRKRQP